MISLTSDKKYYHGTYEDKYIQIIVSIIASILLTFEYWCFGPYSAMYGYGAGLETIPVYKGLALTGSTWAYWAPFVAGGVDRISFWGNADPYNFEPILFNFLPTWVAAAIHLFLQRFIPIFVIMRIAETQLLMPCKWAILTGIIYGCLSYPTPGYMLSEASIVVAIWLIPIVSQSRYPMIGSIALGFVLSCMSSFIWSEPIVPLFVVCWFYVVLNNRNISYFKYMFMVFIIQFLCESPQLLAMLNNAPSSHRAKWPAEELSLSWAGLFYYQMHYDLFNQDKILKIISISMPLVSIFIGTLSIIIGSRSNNIYSVFFLRIVFVYLIISSKFIFVGCQEIISSIFPWIRGIFMGRIYMVPAPFLIPLMTALSLFAFSKSCQRILAHYPKISNYRINIIARSLICVMIMFLIIRPKIFLLDELLIHGWGNQNYEIAALERIKKLEKMPFRVASILPLQPSYAYGQGIETADGWANLYPAVYRDLWLKVISPGMNSLPQMKNIIDPDNSRPQDHYIFLNLDLITPGIGQLPKEDPNIAMIEGFDLDKRVNIELLSLLNVKYILSELPLKGKSLFLETAPAVQPTRAFSRDYATGKLNEIQNLNWGISGMFNIPHAVSEAINRRKKGKEIYIYRNDLALERFRFVNKIEKNLNDFDILSRISSFDINSLKNTALIAPEFSDLISEADGWASGSVLIKSYKPDEIDLLLQFEGEKAFLVIANTWNPDWVSYVNGEKRSLIRVNHAQFGLKLKKGEFNVHLSYEPPYRIVNAL